MLDVPIVQPRYDAVPIFPLPSFAIFPNTMTRLHVFEPRYRLLTAEALASSRLIVLVGLNEGWEGDYYGSPPTHNIGSLCKIINEERLDDGRYNLYVHCLARVQLTQVHRLMPYRVASVQVLPDLQCDPAVLDETTARLLSTVRSLVVKLGDNGAPLGQILGSTRKPILLANRLAAVLAHEPAERQRLLEDTNPLTRIERLADLAGDLLLRADFPEIDFGQVDLSVVN